MDTDDLRVCFLGDSVVAGVGDPEHLGWAGRLAARSARTGRPLTAYNLGVRGHTSRDVSRHFLRECEQRLPDTADGRIVICFGTDDSTDTRTGPRVPPGESAAHLASTLYQASVRGWAALVIGPPPVADPEHNTRIEQLDALFRTGSVLTAVPYISVFRRLRDDPTWSQQVRRAAGAHPTAAGYRTLTDLVWPTWDRWTTTPPEQLRGRPPADEHWGLPSHP